MPRRLQKTAHRRKREMKTNFRQRLELLKSGKPRFIVRRANKNMLCQISIFQKTGDVTKVSASSAELADFGWKANTGNIPASYLTGLLCAVRAKAKGINEAVFDVGLFEGMRGSRMFSALKGAVDGELEIPHSEDAFPSDDRLNGSHISNYAAELKKTDKAKFDKYFSAYAKEKTDPEKLSDAFESAKKNIISDGAKKKAEPKKQAKPKSSKPAAKKTSEKPKKTAEEQKENTDKK